MDPSIITYAQISLSLSFLWLVLRFFSPYIFQSPLDNIPGPPSRSFWKGNIPELYSRHDAWTFHKMLGEKYGTVVRLRDLFGKRALYVSDPKALHQMVVKEQDSFEIASFQLARRNLFMGPGLASTTGEQHRLQRKSLNPVFSINHMRYLTPIFWEIAHKMRVAIQRDVGSSAREVDVLAWMGRMALELVGQGGLGYSFDPLDAEMQDTYGHALKRVQPMMVKNRMWVMLSNYHTLFGPPWLQRILASLVPDKHFQHLKTLVDTMDQYSKQVFREKKDAFMRGDEAVKEQVGQGKDIMSILMRANMQAAEEDKLPEEEVIAQMSTFVLAGTDTTSSALARLLDLLAHHPDVQEKLRSEIIEARGGQDISYDDLVNLPYLDAVCRETFRLHTPVVSTARETTKDAMLPLSSPIIGLDGTVMNEMMVPRGTTVYIAHWLSNIDKKLWGDDADEWKPERWLSPPPDALKEARIPGVYANLMTFSGGGRACIGFKFSQLEMKVVLCILVENFVIRPSTHHIVWNFSEVAFPSVEGDDSKPSLPLMFEPVKKH